QCDKAGRARILRGPHRRHLPGARPPTPRDAPMTGPAMSMWSRLAIPIMALALSAGGAFAQTWFQPDGQPIHGVGNNHPPKVLPDGAGGALFVWANTSAGKVYVPRV